MTCRPRLAGRDKVFLLRVCVEETVENNTLNWCQRIPRDVTDTADKVVLRIVFARHIALGEQAVKAAWPATTDMEHPDAVGAARRKAPGMDRRGVH